MNELEALLAGIVSDPTEETRWLVLADWLEEQDPRRAELLRLHRKLLTSCCESDKHPERSEWQARIVELIGQGVRPCVPQRTLELPGGVAMTFSFIPPGSFLMVVRKALATLAPRKFTASGVNEVTLEGPRLRICRRPARTAG
jgi:uncharacterized protein (TIGR02996 family)